MPEWEEYECKRAYSDFDFPRFTTNQLEKYRETIQEVIDAFGHPLFIGDPGAGLAGHSGWFGVYTRDGAVNLTSFWREVDRLKKERFLQEGDKE